MIFTESSRDTELHIEIKCLIHFIREDAVHMWKMQCEPACFFKLQIEKNSLGSDLSTTPVLLGDMRTLRKMSVKTELIVYAEAICTHLRRAGVEGGKNDRWRVRSLGLSTASYWPWDLGQEFSSFFYLFFLPLHSSGPVLTFVGLLCVCVTNTMKSTLQ